MFPYRELSKIRNHQVSEMKKLTFNFSFFSAHINNVGFVCGVTYLEYICINHKEIRTNFKTAQTARNRQIITKGPFTLSVSVNAAMTLSILFLLKTMGSLQNGVEIHFQVTTLLSMITELLASSQSCHTIDADAWYKWALTYLLYYYSYTVIVILSYHFVL